LKSRSTTIRTDCINENIACLPSPSNRIKNPTAATKLYHAC
jgi:hypothetical protein